MSFVKADVQNVDFRFCDDIAGTTFLQWKKAISIIPGQETEICLRFTTNSEEPRKIIYGFTEWFLNRDWLQVCDSNKWPSNGFSKYIKNTEERSFIIQKDQTTSIYRHGRTQC